MPCAGRRPMQDAVKSAYAYLGLLHYGRLYRVVVRKERDRARMAEWALGRRRLVKFNLHPSRPMPIPAIAVCRGAPGQADSLFLEFAPLYALTCEAVQ